MKNAIDQLVHSILQKDSLEQCSTDELEELVDRYPYFGPAHVLLAAKLKNGDKNKYDNYLQKALLYFNNPFWFDQLINEKGHAEIINSKKEDSPSTDSEPAQPSVEKVEEQAKVEIPASNIEASDKPGPDLAFEPYHTVDYFASQGIKYREEEKPTDRFGQQLKSFTDWLKTMKRLPVPEETEETGSGIERKVEELAEHSIENREIITEAMAEVWEKQGDKEKAIEIYNKLSLYNPSKSAYFAAKIEQLKQ